MLIPKCVFLKKKSGIFVHLPCGPFSFWIQFIFSESKKSFKLIILRRPLSYPFINVGLFYFFRTSPYKFSKNILLTRFTNSVGRIIIDPINDNFDTKRYFTINIIPTNVRFLILTTSTKNILELIYFQSATSVNSRKGF